MPAPRPYHKQMTSPDTKGWIRRRRAFDRWYRKATIVLVIVGLIVVIVFNVASPHPVQRQPPNSSPLPTLIRDFDASDRSAFNRKLSDDQGSRRTWSDCSIIGPTGRAIRFDNSQSVDSEYIATLTGSSRDDQDELRSCTLWVYWDYIHGWTVDAVPFPLVIPTTTAALPLAHTHTDHWEDALIRVIISTFDKNESIQYINLFQHDEFSGYAWSACSIISPRHRTVDTVGSNGRDEILVTITGVSKKNAADPRACTFWLTNDVAYDDGWEVDGQTERSSARQQTELAGNGIKSTRHCGATVRV